MAKNETKSSLASELTVLIIALVCLALVVMHLFINVRNDILDKIEGKSRVTAEEAGPKKTSPVQTKN